MEWLRGLCSAFASDIPGPRCLANGQEIARHGGELVGGITAYADDAEEMRAK